MPNTRLTVANIRQEVSTLLGGQSINIELGEADINKCILDAIQLYNRNVPRRNEAALSVSASQSKYLITQPNLIGVVQVKFVGSGIQFGASTEFGPPFSNVSPTGLGIAGATFGEVNLAVGYAKEAAQIASAEPEWQGYWEGSNYYLYIYVPTVQPINCSYTFDWGVTSDNDATTGMQNIPDSDVDWVLDYAAARAKRILARILGKFGGIPNVSGGEDPTDADALREEAKEDETRLKEEIERRRRPLPPVVG